MPVKSCHGSGIILEKSGAKIALNIFVWIIHGKGEGILREEVRKRLNNHPLVESFTTADQAHGEEGATQVDIKK